jgi:hypothetical protein
MATLAKITGDDFRTKAVVNATAPARFRRGPPHRSPAGL